MQRRVDRYYGIFLESVARKRGMSAERVESEFGSGTDCRSAGRDEPLDRGPQSDDPRRIDVDETHGSRIRVGSFIESSHRPLSILSWSLAERLVTDTSFCARSPYISPT